MNDEGLKLLDIKGIGEKTAKKLERAGVKTPKQLAMMTASELVSRTDLSEGEALSLIEAARVELEKTLRIGVMRASEYYEALKRQPRLTTGVKGLDKILDGGLETEAITEFVGPYGSGKTQLMHQLCVTVQLTENRGGLNGSALYFDTERGFTPWKIEAIAKRFNVEPRVALENVYYVNVVDADHQVALLDTAEEYVREHGVKLIVVDSFTNHFRKQYLGRDNLVLRQQKINKYIGFLLRLAITYNVAVAVTNQVVASPDPRMPGDRAVGGHIVGHGTTHRIWLSRAKGSRRLARVIDSPRLPEAEALIEISDSGLYDAEAV
ncbi:MAG: DNA repair and recombination protein RadA [Candidatus Nezhaarchaeales archaeon]